MLATGKKSYDQSRQHIKKQRHYFSNKGPSGQSYGFSSSHVWMWELDYKKGWAPKNWCFWTVVLEKTLESPLDCKEIQPVHPEGNQSWIFFGRADVEAETPIFWPPDAKNWLIWKDPDAGTDWGQEEKGMADGWMASLTQWTWVWVNSGSWWWTGRPGLLQSMGSPRVRHIWATDLNWNEEHRLWGLLSFCCCLVTKLSDSLVSCQVPLSMGFPRHESWSSLPFPLQGIFPTQGLNTSLLHWQMDCLPLSHQRSPKVSI